VATPAETQAAEQDPRQVVQWMEWRPEIWFSMVTVIEIRCCEPANATR
jgi:hypothetical protein